MHQAHQETERSVAGGLYALAAFGTWGLAPLYFRLLEGVPAAEIVAHRVAWSAVMLLALAAALRRLGPVLAVLRSPRLLAGLAGTSILIGANWLTFLWAIERHELLQVSLGYFINPLVNVALGAALLREKLTRAQAGAVVLAGTSVLVLALGARQVPVLALFLAGTFALYGLFRKLMPVDPLTGLLAETALLWPLAVGFLAVVHSRGDGAWTEMAGGSRALLIASGAVTAVPLLCFVAAARRLTLISLGFFQYLAPSLQFVTAVLLWDEPFDGRRLLAFCGIWAALALVSLDTLRRARHRRD